MRDKIRRYVDELLRDIPKTRPNLELKEELIGNMQARYDDLIAGGHTEKDAYDCAIDQAGDIRSLFETEEKSSVQTAAETAADKKRALLRAAAVALYIMAVPVVAILDETAGLENVSLVAFFGIIALATGIMVYLGSTGPARRKGETVADEFKEWKEQTSRSKATYKAIKSCVWTAAWILFIVLFFGMGRLFLGICVFAIAECVCQLIKALFFYE